MKIRYVILAFAFCGFAGQAQARRDPQPKPSGIVVHLFGPDSIMSGIVPDLPGQTAGRPGTAPVSPGPQATTGAVSPLPSGIETASPTPVAAASASGSDDPSLGAVLHQMFVVGDPNHPNLPSVGRAADHPQAADGP